MWTLIEPKEGLKLWFIYDPLTCEEMETAANLGAEDERLAHPNPCAKAVPLLLESSWLFLQPPGRINFPMSVDDALMTGCMLLDVANIEGMLEQSLFEFEVLMSRIGRLEKNLGNRPRLWNTSLKGETVST